MKKLNITSRDFEKYLRSIGGLINGYSPHPSKQANPFRYRLFIAAQRIGIENSKNPFRLKIKNRSFFMVKEGWLELTKMCISDCIEAGWDKELLQCKQNYGTLKFRINQITPKILSVIKNYENISKRTCECCGTMDSVTQTKGWVMSLCPDCIVKEKEFKKTAKFVPSGKFKSTKYKKKSFKKKKESKPLNSKLSENDF
jgi:hypothetical protein